MQCPSAVVATAAVWLCIGTLLLGERKGRCHAREWLPSSSNSKDGDSPADELDNLVQESYIANDTPSPSLQPLPPLSQDTIATFLQKVDQYGSSSDGKNCTAGTELNLGPGVVQQYGVLRFRAQAEAAVNRANLLTRMWMEAASGGHLAEQSSRHDHGKVDGSSTGSGSGSSSSAEHAGSKPSTSSDWIHSIFFSQVVNLVESDRDIFAYGNCYDAGEFGGRYLFCPYAYRLPGGSSGILVKDLSTEYDYLSNQSDWFYPARRRAEQIVALREPSTSYEKVALNGTLIERNRSVLLVTYEDGHWSRPYFDCGGGNIWMMTYTVPFFGFSNGNFKFKGTSGIDIDLQKVDINQCPLPPGKIEMNVFANSSRCLPETTECVPVHGLGFRRGSYKCVCKDGFYFPLLQTDREQRYYNGVTVETEYEKYAKGEQHDYFSFQCLPCPAGCDTCEDDRPCILTLNWVMRQCLLVASCLIACVVPGLAYFVWHYREVKVVKASSPKLLCLILVGALFLYGPVLVSYFEASVLICCLRQWLRAIGFCMSYGALMLKTWRISIVFRVRSAQKVKISDSDLIKRLGIIVLVAAVYLTVRMIWGRPEVTIGYYIGGERSLKAFQCSFDVWDYCQAGGEMLLLLWGIRLCIIVRKAPSEFNESRFISWAIYNETLLSLFLALAMLFLQSPANPDLLYVVQFIHTNLTTTVTLIFLFGSKAYLMHRRKEKESTKDESLLKKNSSTSGIMKYSKSSSSSKKSTQQAMTSDCYDAPPAILQKDIEDELTRVYTELETLKRAQMRQGNPHLPSKTSGGALHCLGHGHSRKSGSCSAAKQHSRNGGDGVIAVIDGDGGRISAADCGHAAQPRRDSDDRGDNPQTDGTGGSQPHSPKPRSLPGGGKPRHRSASASTALRRLLLDIRDESVRATSV